ncbi:hypothetical protein ACEN88_35760, partial [Massilia sp. CT11-108]|uniref:hypothetical protein n=1 Tax=Massilia sp. CT11-108 TaxID=3393900 RepID=UPI0039A6B991
MVSHTPFSTTSADRLVTHGTDVLYTFGAPVIGIGGNWTESDKVISAQMIDYWYVNYPLGSIRS